MRGSFTPKPRPPEHRQTRSRHSCLLVLFFFSSDGLGASSKTSAETAHDLFVRLCSLFFCSTTNVPDRPEVDFSVGKGLSFFVDFRWCCLPFSIGRHDALFYD